MTDILNALALLGNFVIVPGLAYGSQLALGALGVTMIYAVLRFSNFAHGETMSVGAMITILATWWLQGKGVSLGTSTYRASSSAHRNYWHDTDMSTF